MSIARNLIVLAATEGTATALRTAEDIISSLETCAECGNSAERRHARALIAAVDGAIKEIMDGRAVVVARGAFA